MSAIYRNALAALLLAAAVSAAATQADAWRAAEDLGPDPTHEKYEELFDAAYPARRFDPFGRLHPFEEVRAFNRGFDRRAAGVATRVTEEGRAVAVEIEWPGSAPRPIDVRVAGRSILLRAAAPGRGSAYRFVAGAKEIVVDLPRGAKPESARVERSGDVVRVTFAKSG
jgi:HSP20 family molecular chaperone IbpA